MKKIAVLLILFLTVSSTFAQKKNGTVYNEHESIDKTRQLWKAFAAGDLDTYRSYFADSIGYIRNGGQYNKVPNAGFGGAVSWWEKNVDNVMVKDDAPAYPDAIDYDQGGLWVQDWIVLSGTHRESGINIDLHLHNLYSFDDNGKIAMFIQYYNDDIFEEINNSAFTRENGTVYINHPYIVAVRKLVNAICAEDMGTVLSFYAENARFSTTSMNWGESIGLDERKAEIQKHFDEYEDITMKQIGYPDCIYYEKNNEYVVYSWWEYSITVSATGKKVVMPIMLSNTFDEAGKISNETAYFSTNHFQDE